MSGKEIYRETKVTIESSFPEDEIRDSVVQAKNAAKEKVKEAGSQAMEKAKEMLETTHKKVVTVSNEVGYENVSYFCQSFREYFGVSPQKFRDQG